MKIELDLNPDEILALAQTIRYRDHTKDTPVQGEACAHALKVLETAHRNWGNDVRNLGYLRSKGAL